MSVLARRSRLLAVLLSVVLVHSGLAPAAFARVVARVPVPAVFVTPAAGLAPGSASLTLAPTALVPVGRSATLVAAPVAPQVPALAPRAELGAAEAAIRVAARAAGAGPVASAPAVAPNGVRGPPTVPATVRVSPPLSKQSRSQLARLAGLDSAGFASLSDSLRRTEFAIPGALPFSADTTFSLEVEFEMAPQIRRGRRREEDYSDHSDRLIDSMKAAIPKGWGMESEVGGEDLKEFQTRNSGGVYHLNTPKDWQELKRGLVRAQELLPGGLKSVHIHIGRRRSSSNKIIRVEPQRLGMMMKVYESMWAALAGYGYGPFHEDDERAYDADILSNKNWKRDGKSPVFGHGLWVNMSDEFPTLEYKIAKGLLRTPGRGPKYLDVDRLGEHFWWSFAFFEHLLTNRKPVPLAELGLPVAAGELPSSARLAAFLDLVYGGDIVGKAIALKRFSQVGQSKWRVARKVRKERRAEIRNRYHRMGLGVVFELHERHDGHDTKLVERLLADRGLLATLAGDLNAASTPREVALGYFPKSLHGALRRALAENPAAAMSHEHEPQPRPSYEKPRSETVRTIAAWFAVLTGLFFAWQLLTLL